MQLQSRRFSLTREPLIMSQLLCIADSAHAAVPGSKQKMALNTGEIIEGKYRIIRLLGEGGMGAVYEGENTLIHRRVAIKVLHAGVAENKVTVQRFEREAQAAGRIGSEHIVEVLDLGTLESGDRFMVMEFMDGDSLAERLENVGKISAEDLCPLAEQMLDGLQAAHNAEIIHRDLKPDNVFLLKSRGGTTDFVKLLDFGISKFNAMSNEEGFSMTKTGVMMGTPYYMSPEQAKGSKAMNHRADLYSIGVILYECVTGQVPFNADTFNELLFKIGLEDPPPIHDIAPEVPSSFVRLISKAMTRDPNERFQTANEFKDALSAWAENSGVQSVRPMAPNMDPPTGTGLMPSPATPHTLTPGRGSHVPGSALPGASLSLGTGTPGNWAQSTPAPYIEGASGGNKSTYMVATLAGLVLLAGGGAAFTTMNSAEPEVAPIATGPTPAELAQKAAEEAREETRLARARADEEKEARHKAEEAATKATESAEATRAAAAEAEAERKLKAEEAEAKTKAARARRAASKPKAKAKAAPAAAPHRRKIRTEL